MEIITYVHNSQLPRLKTFLDSFKLHCTDYDKCHITFLVTNFDSLILSNVKLDVNISIQSIDKYLKCNELELLEKVKKQTFSSLAKMTYICTSQSEYICVFDIDCIFIRQFSMEEHMKLYKNFHYYSSHQVSYSYNQSVTHVLKCDIVKNLRTIFNKNFFDFPQNFNLEYEYYKYAKEHKLNENYNDPDLYGFVGIRTADGRTLPIRLGRVVFSKK